METNNYDCPNNSLEAFLLADEGNVFITALHEDPVIDKYNRDNNIIKITTGKNIENQIVDAPILQQEVDIHTVSINKYVDVLPETIRYEGDTMIISVLKEIAVVRTLLEKEIHVTKRDRWHNIQKQSP